MTINDLKVDIIASVSRLSDLSLLEKIRNTIKADSVSNNAVDSSIWKGAELEIREGVSFEQLMREQDYEKISFLDFTEDTIGEEWEVSLDVLLSNAK